MAEDPGGPPSLRPIDRISLRHLARVGLASIFLALLMNWPIVRHLNHGVPRSLGDPLFEAWQVGWVGHALLHQPLHYLDANIFWPLRHSLAFNDAMLGYAPIGAIGSGPAAALVRYNLLFLFSYSLAFTGAYLLAREVGLDWGGAAVAGAAFAFCPWRLSQTDHLNILSTGGIPLTFFFLIRGWRTRRGWLVLAGWLVATWQLSLGFGVGLEFTYALIAFAGMAALLWVRRGRPTLGRRTVAATLIGLAIFLAWGAFQSRPYFQVARDYPEALASRTVARATFFSPKIFSYLVAPADSFLWGRRTGRLRNRLDAPEEEALFPGALTALLAGLALSSARFPRSLRAGLLAAGSVTGLLALGFHLGPAGRVYRFLWDHAPGWNGIRTPGRITTLTTLVLALLAGMGTHFLLARLRTMPSVSATLTNTAHVALPLILVGTILLEGFGHYATPSVPAAPLAPALASAGSLPRFDLPSRKTFDYVYEFWSTQGFYDIVNGTGTFSPRATDTARRMTWSFPDQTSVDYLRGLGVRFVVLHVNLARKTRWKEVADRPIDGLGISAQMVDNLIIYDLRP